MEFGYDDIWFKIKVIKAITGICKEQDFFIISYFQILLNQFTINRIAVNDENSRVEGTFQISYGFMITNLSIKCLQPFYPVCLFDQLHECIYQRQIFFNHYMISFFAVRKRYPKYH